MAATRISNALDPVKQFSIFAENRVGLLFGLTDLLRTHDVHIMAITVLDTTDSAIIRLIVDDPDRMREILVKNALPYSECEVIAVAMTDESKLKGVLAALLEAEINIHYVYSFLMQPEGKSALVVSVEDREIAGQALNQRGFKTLTQHDISR